MKIYYAFIHLIYSRKAKAYFSIISGFILHVTFIIMRTPIASNASDKILDIDLHKYAFYIGGFLSIWGFSVIAKEKGYPGSIAWAGIIPIIGTIFLTLLPNRNLVEKDFGKESTKSSKYKKKSNIMILIGFLLIIIPNYFPYIFIENFDFIEMSTTKFFNIIIITTMVGFFLYTYGCILYVRSKMYRSYIGLLGLIPPLIGYIFLVLLPEKSRNSWICRKNRVDKIAIIVGMIMGMIALIIHANFLIEPSEQKIFVRNVALNFPHLLQKDLLLIIKSIVILTLNNLTPILFLFYISNILIVGGISPFIEKKGYNNILGGMLLLLPYIGFILYAVLPAKKEAVLEGKQRRENVFFLIIVAIVHYLSYYYMGRPELSLDDTIIVILFNIKLYIFTTSYIVLLWAFRNYSRKFGLGNLWIFGFFSLIGAFIAFISKIIWDEFKKES